MTGLEVILIAFLVIVTLWCIALLLDNKNARKTGDKYREMYLEASQEIIELKHEALNAALDATHGMLNQIEGERKSG